MLGIPVGEYTLNILISRFCRWNRVDYGFAILGSFFKLGYAQTVTTFNTLISGFILEDYTVELFTKLINEDNFKPNEVTYTTIINGLCKIGNTPVAI